MVDVEIRPGGAGAAARSARLASTWRDGRQLVWLLGDWPVVLAYDVVFFEGPLSAELRGVEWNDDELTMTTENGRAIYRVRPLDRGNARRADLLYSELWQRFESAGDLPAPQPAASWGIFALGVAALVIVASVVGLWHRWPAVVDYFFAGIGP